MFLYIIRIRGQIYAISMEKDFNDILLRICCVIQKFLVILQHENRGESACEKKNIRKGKHHGTTEESTKGERTSPHPSAKVG